MRIAFSTCKDRRLLGRKIILVRACSRLWSSQSFSLNKRRPNLGPVRATREEFENGSFTLKARQVFSVHATPEAFKIATITGRALTFERRVSQNLKRGENDTKWFLSGKQLLYSYMYVGEVSKFDPLGTVHFLGGRGGWWDLGSTI